MCKWKLIFSTLLAMCLVLTFNSDNPAYAEDQTPIDREAMIEEILSQWQLDPATAYEFEGIMEQANKSQLEAILQAESSEEVVAILELGDTDQDYTFTPVTPCRIVDTRNAGGIMTPSSTRSFYVHGNGAIMSGQGGNAAGCTSPIGEPRGVMINITAVPQSNGHFRVYADDVSTPTASILNYRTGVNIANAAAVKTYFGFGPDIEIFSLGTSHLVIDVLGYYDMPESTPLAIYQTSATKTCSSGELCISLSPTCQSGYAVTGGGCTLQYGNPAQDISANRPSPTTGIPTKWECRGTNNESFSQNYTAHVICARIPGW